MWVWVGYIVFSAHRKLGPIIVGPQSRGAMWASARLRRLFPSKSLLQPYETNTYCHSEIECSCFFNTIDVCWSICAPLCMTIYQQNLFCFFSFKAYVFLNNFFNLHVFILNYFYWPDHPIYWTLTRPAHAYVTILYTATMGIHMEVDTAMAQPTPTAHCG